jgi:hypothetical protein
MARACIGGKRGDGLRVPSLKFQVSSQPPDVGCYP